ncbi:MAG TPA: hypothetical protein VGD40_11575 [Chryseosolibacter sp.]
MKKKEIKAKLISALNATLFELQVTPTKRIKKSIDGFSKDLASRVKDDLKSQEKAEKKLATSKKNKNRKPAAG